MTEEFLDSFDDSIEDCNDLDDFSSMDNEQEDYPDDFPTLDNGHEDDPLDVSDEDISTLEERANDIERDERKDKISFGRKMCPSRHGCQGATDCNYAYGDYPG